MNFARPEVFYALPLALIPLLIHLWNRRRFQPHAFAAMRFLEEAIRRTKRRLRLEQLLLLALRTLALLIIIFVLAGPGANAERAANVSARSEIIILDASLSMSHRNEDDTTAFQRAKARAQSSLRGMTTQRGDFAALILAGRQSLVLAAGDPAACRRALGDLETPEESTVHILAALQDIITLNSELNLTRARVHIYSDFQATSWHEQDELADVLSQLDALGFSIQFVNTGAAVRPNVGLLELSLEPAHPSGQESALVQIRLRNYGESETSREITLLLNDSPIARHTLALAPGSESSWLVPIVAPSAGQHRLTAHIPTDELRGDDTRSLVLVVEPRPQILFVQDSASQQSNLPAAAFLRYLGLDDPQSPWQTLTQSPSELSAIDLQGIDICILADPRQIPALAADALLKYMQNDGQLLVLAGPQLAGQTATTLEGLAAELGLPPIDFQGIRPQSDGSSTRLHIRDDQHPALRFFQDERWLPLLTEVPHRAFRIISAPSWNSPLAFEDGSPAFLEFNKFSVLAALPYPEWNRMEEIPSGTLPFVHDLLRYLGPRDNIQRALTIPAVLPLSETKQSQGQLVSPDGLQLDWQSPRAVRATQAGIWRFESTRFLPNGDTLKQNDLFAVHPPSSESDLRMAAPERLQALIPQSSALVPTANSVLPGREAQLHSTTQSNAPHPWPWFSALLAILLFESLVAYRIDARRAA
ncbi:MAG: VWA domain-containing protein [Planctomycetes bacterium]|jgi:hypothetical protein|nr:VWA domain-containing protein [Planctomycetota bacterium]MBT7013302.1 VWA domain-containing protein [Planctomycetota bacterium]